jgi:TP901 family phage tail tape measure protein
VDDLQILLKAVIDENSQSSLDSKLASIAKSLSESHTVKLKVGFDEDSVKTVQSQLQTIAKQVGGANHTGTYKPLQVFDATQLKADGQRYFTSVKDIVSRAQAEFSKLGKTDITNVFKDSKGNIQSFTASVTKADGVVEKFNFNLAKIKDGAQSIKGFVQSNSILTDKNAGSNLEQTLNYLNRINTKIADITSKTLTNTSKPLLGDMEQFNQYQEKLNAVKARIEEIKQSNTTLSSEHKREIDSMVADLQRYAKELQTSAYAATDLKANTFANQKAELQASLETQIKKWQNAGIFGGDFKASVEEAKTALDNALNPNDLDAYRHKLALLEQQFKQIKLDNTASGKLLDAEKLNSNIQTAQLRIQNLKQTYSAFVSDPSLMSKWQQLFDESQMVSSSKELTNLNAKIRLFEQELISADKHSQSLFGELKNNIAKMGSWMVLGGVIAGIMRGVTGLYDAVVDLDTAMTELKKVTDETDESYDRFLSDAAQKAVDIGTSYSDYVTATANFARLGYSMADASDLAEVATIYSVVGDEISDVNEATSSIISTMKAFGIEASDAMTIVDKFNKIGNEFAISSGGVGDALQRSASAMAAANNTIDESIALIVAANNVVQDPAAVGTMWKTVAMRIRGAKTELEEAGLETEYMAESTAKLQDQIKGLTNVDGSGGFDIMADADNFKSTYEIILGISKVWEKMSDIDQAALLELLAGKRQGNALAAAIENMDDAVSAMNASVNAEGSALAEHEKWMDSIEAKQQKFQAQYQALAKTILNSDLIKGAYDAGTGLLGWLTKLIETLGAFPTILAGITPFFDKLQLLKTTTSKNWLGTGTGISFAWNSGKLELENDIRLLDEYKTKIQGLGTSTSDLTQRQIVWNDTIGRGSSSLKTAVHVTDDATISTDAYRSSMTNASASTTAMGVASKAAAVGVQVLKTALNMLISLGIGLAISAIVSGISKLINKAKEARQATVEAGTAAAEDAQKLYDLASSYIELSNAVEAGTGSQEDLIAIQDELIAYLKDQGVAVDNLSGSYADLRDNIIDAARTQLQTDISKGVRAANVAKEDAVKELDGYFNSHSFYSATGKEAGDAMAYLKELGFTGIDDSGSKGGGTIFLPSVYSSDGGLKDVTFEDLAANYKYLQDAMNAVRDKFGSENPVFEVLADAYNEYDAALSDAIDQIDKNNQMIAEDAFLAAQKLAKPESLDQFEKMRKDLIQQVQNDLSFDENGTYSAEELVDKTLGTNDYYAGLLDELNQRENQAKQVNEKMQAIAEALVPKNYEQYEPGTSAHFHELDAWLAEADEVKEKLRGLSDEEFEIAYDAVINQGATTWDDITAAIEKYNSEQEVARRHSEQLKTTIKSLWNSENFADAKEELMTLSTTLDGITAENVKELAEESGILASVLDEDGMNAQFLAHILQVMAEGGDGVALITEQALKLNDALDGMVDKFDSVTDAKARYDAAMSVEEKDTDFKSYAEAFEELNKQFEAGTTNSNAFWAAAEFLFGSDQLSTWGWGDGLDEIYSAMEKNKIVFEDADSAGAGFVERLYQMSQAGQLVNDQGEKLLDISKDSDGAYVFDIDPDNLDAIAEKMGITTDAVLACLEALSMWGDIDFYDMNEVADVIDEIGLSAENAGKKAINVSALTDQLITLGKTDKEIYDILTGLQDLDGVVLLDAEGSIDGLTNSLTNLGLAASDGITVNVDAEALAPLLSELNFTKEQAEDLITKLGEADGISLTNSQGEIKDTTDALEYLNGLDFATVTSNVDGVAQAVDDVDDETTDNVVNQFNNIETAASDAETAVKRVQTAVQHLDGQTATVTIDTKRKSGILGGIFGYASGTGAAPAGDALVGEEGAELIQSGDKAYLAGVNGAEVVNLKQGDRVYTADETKRIVHGSGKQLKGVIPAYAKGRVQTGGLHVETDKTGSTGTPIKFNATVEATIDDKTLEDQLKDKLDDLEEQLSDIIGNFEHSIFLLEKNDGTPEQIIAIYRKMQETVHAQAEKYRALGLDDTSDYIQDLQKKWWDYQDTIEDMLHDIYQTAVDNHNNMLSLLENQYDMLDNNQTKDAMLDNLYKQLEEQKKIQEEAHKEERRLRDLGLDENDEAIQDCINAWWGAYNDIQDINSKIADNVLDTFDDFIDYADDFDLWGDFNFTKVDYLKQKLKEINRLFEEGVLTLKEYNSLMRETGVEIYNEQKDALTKIIEMTMELVRQEAEDQVDALEAQIDAFRKIIDLKKESLSATKDEEDYQRTVAEKVAEIAEKQAKLAQLDRDTSASANAEKQKLAQELAQLQQELADYQADYAYNSQVDALDKEADTFENTKNDEISYVKSTVDTEEKVYNAAISRINSNWEQLYTDLIEWNKQYGDMIDGEDSITSAWRTAKAAAQEYGDVVSALNGINSEISYAGKNADDKQTQIDRILSKMQTNSKGWHTAKTQEEKNRLVKENEDLAEQLSALLGRKVVKVNGVWYLDSANGPRLFHTGLDEGYVGGRATGADEVLSVLKDGELVMTKDQYMRIFNSLKYGITGVLDSLIGNLTSTSPAVSEVVKSITNDNSNTDNSSTDDRVTIQNYFQMQNVTEENMKGFAEYYADFTIGKLISANRRKGIRNKVANSMLRG